MVTAASKDLRAFYERHLGHDVHLFGDVQVDADAQRHRRAQVCAECLRSAGLARLGWDLACVTACSVHRCLLTDICSACGAPITWNSAHIFYCDDCGTDLRTLPAAPVERAMAETNEDYEPLASFSVRLHDGIAVTVPWDRRCRVFKLVALDESRLLADDWPDRQLVELSVERRHVSTEVIASIRSGQSCDRRDLGPALRGRMEFLSALPKRGLGAAQARRLARSGARLSSEVSSALADETAVKPRGSGAELFSGVLRCSKAGKLSHGSSASMTWLSSGFIEWVCSRYPWNGSFVTTSTRFCGVRRSCRRSSWARLAWRDG